MNAIVPVSPNPLMPQDLDQAIRLAKAMSSAKAVPEHLQGDVGSCLMIVEQSIRWRMSPFAVAQCTSSIKGKLMYEGKLIAAVVETSGAIDGYLNYKWAGEGESRSITVSATRRGEAEPKEMTVLLKNVATSNDQWKKQPDQQLVYSGARSWARRWTPAVMLGVYAPEEFDRASGRVVTEDGPVIEHEPDPRPEPPANRTAAEPTLRDKINSDVPVTPPKPVKLPPFREFLKGLETAMRTCKSLDEVNRVIERPETQQAMATYKDDAKTQLDGIIAEAIGRWRHVAPQSDTPPDDDPWSTPPDWVTGEVEIVGADKVAAG